MDNRRDPLHAGADILAVTLRTMMNEWLPDASDAGHGQNPQLPIDRLVLHKPCGSPCSLHRYAGRWIILRVAPSLEAGALLPAATDGLDAVALNVIAGPVNPSPAVDNGAGPIVFDTEHSIEARFPSLGWPSTFVLDPGGKLVAILSDQASGAFLADLVRSQRTLLNGGTIDRRDLHT